jgi:hypothetical protein
MVALLVRPRGEQLSWWCILLLVAMVGAAAAVLLEVVELGSSWWGIRTWSFYERTPTTRGLLSAVQFSRSGARGHAIRPGGRPARVRRCGRSWGC